MAQTIEQLKRRTQELKQQRIDAGYAGEEYEKWSAKKPKPPRRLALGCYEELQPLYVFLTTYAQKSAADWKPLKFDVSRLDVYRKYLRVMRYHNALDYNFSAFSLEIGCEQVIKILNGQQSFHKGMEVLLGTLKHWELPSHLPQRDTSRAYRGEHFEALVDRYYERINAHVAEGAQIAADNLKKRGETNE